MKDSCFMIRDQGTKSPVVVIPAADHDSQMMIKNLSWMENLGGCKAFDAVVNQDESMHPIVAKQLIEHANKVFASVRVVRYQRPPMTRWPWAANWAFQCAAWYMLEELQRPWFWMEADCVPLKKGWLEAWFGEYRTCGKPLMGAIVDGRGHLNGTAIYPYDFAEISPVAMRSTDVAWDWEMRAETIHLSHHSKLLCHVWGIVNGNTSPYDGPSAQFTSQQEVDRWVCPDAVLFHRSKEGSLIDRLRERMAAGKELVMA